MSAQATSELQSMSGAVTVNSTKINSDVNTINNQTLNDQSKERQVLIGLNVDESGDYPTAELTSAIGPEGPVVAKGAVETIIDSQTDGNGNVTSSRFRGTNLRPVAQAHTHNTYNVPGMGNDATTSEADKNASILQGITRYAVDSWSGAGGNDVHRVTSDGTQTNSVGCVQTFNFGQDALDEHIGN